MSENESVFFLPEEPNTEDYDETDTDDDSISLEIEEEEIYAGVLLNGEPVSLIAFTGKGGVEAFKKLFRQGMSKSFSIVYRGEKAGKLHLKYRPEGKGEIVLSNINIYDSFQRIGLGTKVVQLLVENYPDSCISGENLNTNSCAWHRNGLEKDPLISPRLVTSDLRACRCLLECCDYCSTVHKDQRLGPCIDLELQ